MNGPLVLRTLAALALAGCQAGAEAPPMRPAQLVEDHATAGDERDPGPAVEARTDLPFEPERAIEIQLPRPALWVEASPGLRLQVGVYVARSPHQGPRHCGAVWLEEARHVLWVEGGETRAVEEPLSRAWGRAGAYRDLPIASPMVCDVTSRMDLRCRRHRCAFLGESEGMVDRSACELDPPPGRPSDIQRTRGFVPTRHWRRSDPFRGHLSYTCLRRDGRIRCFPLDFHEPRPRPVPAPALDAWSNVRDLSAAGSQACAVLEDGSVHCWGMPYMPEVAEDRSDEEALFEAMLEHSGHPWTPRRIEGLPPAVQVSVGLRLACARTGDGRVFCWGAPECLRPPRFPSP